MKKIEKKINDQELAKIKSLSEEISNCKVQITEHELAKHSFISRLFRSEQEFKMLQNELMEKYGKVSINVNDGTFKEIKDNAANS